MREVVKFIAPANLASVLAEGNIPFIYNFGIYYIPATDDIEKVKKVCKKIGISEEDLYKMDFSNVALNIEHTYFEEL